MGLTARAQTNALEYDQALVRAAQAVAALEPITNQFIPVPNTNPPPPDLMGNYYSLQMSNLPPLPFPQWQDLPVYLLDPTNRIFVLDDRAVDYAAMQPPAVGIPFTSFAMGSIFTPTPSPPACGTGGPAYLTNFTATPSSNGNYTISFIIAGGSPNVIYDLLTATNLAGTNTQWLWLGQGFCCDTYTFFNQPAAQAYYRLGLPTASLVVAWGDNTDGQCNVPTGLTNVVAVAGGLEFSLALKADGTLAAWGDDSYGQTEIPSGATNVVAISADWYGALALRADGTVVKWGAMTNPVPAAASNLVAVAQGYDYAFALQSDGNLLTWGQNSFRTNLISLANVIAIAAGTDHKAALLGNGSVAAWGDDFYGETNVPPDLTNAVMLATGYYHTLALKADGTVESWGYDDSGQTNVPVGLSTVTSVAAGFEHTLALKADGTLALWGQFYDADLFLPQGLSNVVAIGAGGGHCLAICSGLLTPFVVEQPVSQVVVPGGSATLSVYAEAATSPAYQWQLNGTNLIGATNASLALTNVQSAQSGTYDVVVSTAAGSVTSSNAGITLLQPPQIVSVSPAEPSTNWVQSEVYSTLSVTATAAYSVDYPIHYQWLLDGTNLPGANTSSYTITWTNPATQEGAYSVNVSNVEGGTNLGPWQMWLLLPGMAGGWGENSEGQLLRPANLTNVVGLAAGEYQGVAVTESGAVVQWGKYWDGEDFYAVTNFSVATAPPSSNVVAVAAGLGQAVALLNDGTVRAWGLEGEYGTLVPSGLSGITAIACGWQFNVVLRTNGTVTAWGSDLFGETEVPAGLSNVIAISASVQHTLALLGDGTVVAWGDGFDGDTNVPVGLSNVVAIAAGASHNLALKADGTVVAWGLNDYGQTNVPPGLSNVMAIAAGDSHSVALKNDGTVVAWGDNSEGQTNVNSGFANVSNVKLIAAGGDFSLAATFLPLTQYPVNVRNDLLLIYNTNSQDSATVLNYYLANCPGVSNANVLGIGYTNWGLAGDGSICGITNAFYTNNLETITPQGLTNQIFAPIQNWLAANPTKRPQYVVLMLDVPSRVADSNWVYYPTCGNYPMGSGVAVYASVQFQINYFCVSNWNPCVTSINMNGTNDCIGYINKLAAFGSNYAPGKLIISASAGGYGNTNYYFDDALQSYYTGAPDYYGPMGLYALIGVTNGKVPLANVDYKSDTATNHISTATNVAGYTSWGTHAGIYPNLYCTFTGESAWYIMTTAESFNGKRYEADQSNFTDWFSANAFGGSNYSCTPIGGVSTVDEPSVSGLAATQPLFSNWVTGKFFAISSWKSWRSSYFQAIGDPFVTH